MNRQTPRNISIFRGFFLNKFMLYIKQEIARNLGGFKIVSDIMMTGGTGQILVHVVYLCQSWPGSQYCLLIISHLFTSSPNCSSQSVQAKYQNLMADSTLSVRGPSLYVII